MGRLLSLFFLLLLGSNFVCGLIFELYVDQVKCFREELGRDEVVLGEFEVGPSYNTITSIWVTDPEGNPVWKKEGAQDGTFAFTTETDGEFEVCFLDQAKPDLHVPPHTKRDVTFALKTGVDAKDYSALAKKDDLKPIEIEMMKLEDVLEEINTDMKYLRNREDVMRLTNESTNNRVLWLSLTSILVLLSLGLFQIFYLKRYFQQKKLI